MVHRPHVRSRAALQELQAGESIRTIVIALVANVVIAIAKLVAGLMSRSTAMLAEAAHSFADTLSEVLLAVAMHRAKKPPDEVHPLGHGREQFLWALMAAIASFIIGGCFSVAMAIQRLMRGGEAGPSLPAWIVLAISFIADGASWLQSVRQARRDAREAGHDFWPHLRHSSDPVVRAVVLEDSAALAGLVLAAGGLLITNVTGNTAADAIASLLIGILLAMTAFGVARPLADFLVGRSLPADYLEKLRSVVAASPAVDQVVAFQAVYIGPREVIVAAKVRPRRDIDALSLTVAIDDLDGALRDASSFVADVYLDITTSAREPRDD
jgi:cation diffusion facilitator family transporter